MHLPKLSWPRTEFISDVLSNEKYLPTPGSPCTPLQCNQFKATQAESAQGLLTQLVRVAWSTVGAYTSKGQGTQAATRGCERPWIQIT